MRGRTTAVERDGGVASERIAILGLRQAGKSTFLAVLPYALTQEESKWEIKPTRETLKQMMDLNRRVFAEGLYPVPTPEREEVSDVLTFEVMREAEYWGLKEGAVFELRADDIPGGWVPGAAGSNAAFADFYEEYVKGCVGIIFLIDPQHRWLADDPDAEGKGEVKKGKGQYLFTFNSILDELTALHGDGLIIAFCITKLDQEPDGEAYFNDTGKLSPDEFIDNKAAEILGPKVKRQIDNKLRRSAVRWFGVSATGYYEGDDGKKYTQHTMKRHDNKDVIGIARPDLLEPLGVAEAAEWVFDQVAERYIRGRNRRGLFGR